MKDTLSIVRNKETGNTLAICSNIDDAIDIFVTYEMKTNNKNVYEIVEVSKDEAISFIQKPWVKTDMQIVELYFSRNEEGN